MTTDTRTLARFAVSTEHDPPDLANCDLARVASTIAPLEGSERYNTFKAEIAKLNGEKGALWAEIETYLQALDRPAAKTNAEALSLPDLPSYAHLTPEQEHEATGAGAWLDDYVSFARGASPMTPDAFHIAAGLAVGSIAIARRLHLRVSVTENSLYPNLYMLFVGPSTIQRKTTALRVVRGLLKAAGLGHFLLSDRQTPEALSLDLTTRIPYTFDTWTPDLQADWLKERAIAAQRAWLLEEASHLLDSFNRDFSAGLLPMVLDLYDCPAEAIPRNTISRGREVIERPYLSIFGCTTYGAMAEHLNSRALWANGFFARFALVGSSEVGAWAFWPAPRDYPTTLVDKLRGVATQLLRLPDAWIETQEAASEDGDGDGKAKGPRTVKIEPPLGSHAVQIDRAGAAWRAWENYARATTFDLLKGDTVPHQFKASYGRLGTMLVKVAMILAAFDAQRLPVVIEPRHVYRAQQIVESWRANLHTVFRGLGEAQKAGKAEEIKAILARNGNDWTIRRDLLRALNTTWAKLEPEIDDLANSGEIEREEYKPTRGPGSEQYRLLAGLETVLLS